VATKWTLAPTVLPFEGLDTVTPAKADVAAGKKTERAIAIRAYFFIFFKFSPDWIVGLGPVKLYNSEGYTDRAGHP